MEWVKVGEERVCSYREYFMRVWEDGSGVHWVVYNGSLGDSPIGSGIASAFYVAERRAEDFIGPQGRKTTGEFSQMRHRAARDKAGEES